MVGFLKQLKGEVEKEWLSYALKWSKRMPFQKLTAELVAKNQAGKFRITCNASAPMPDQRRGMVKFFDNERRPVRANYDNKIALGLEL